MLKIFKNQTPHKGLIEIKVTLEESHLLFKIRNENSVLEERPNTEKLKNPSRSAF